MVDIHSHILPLVDDGPRNKQGFIEMANTAVKSGIKSLFATPHHRNGFYQNPSTEILWYVHEINDFLQQEKIPLTIYPGQEVRIHRNLFSLFEQGEILTLNNDGKYLLLELPSSEVPAYTFEMIYELLLKDITPIIVHPERNREIMENKSLLFELVSEGALTQLTAGSIIGHFGSKIRNFSQKIIEHQQAHFIATDAHNLTNRGFFLHEAYEIISKSTGVYQTCYFKENAERILRNESIQKEQPIPIRKKILGVF